jgi:hypothetical protein
VGFVSRLHCPVCGFHDDQVGFGLGAGSCDIYYLIQNRVTGEFRKGMVLHSEVVEHCGLEKFYSEQDFIDGFKSYIEAQLGPNENSITPEQAICPKCLGKLNIEAYGFM